MHPLQQKLYELVHIRGLRKFASFRELGEAIGGNNHPQQIKHHLMQLEKQGVVNIDWENYRIEPKLRTERLSKMEALSVPVLGAANCGLATLIAEERPEGVLMISKSLVPATAKDVFALRAVGDSMNQARVNSKNPILDGDYVIIDKDTSKIKNGDYVLSIINGAANIKRFEHDTENQRVVLHSESDKNYPPIIIHDNDEPDLFVNGKVVSVIRATNALES